MQLFKFEVRQDWQEYDHRKIMEFARLWRFLFVIVFLSIVVNLVIIILRISLPWGIILRILFSYSLLLTLTLWTVFRTQEKGRKRTYQFLALFSFAGVITAIGSYLLSFRISILLNNVVPLLLMVIGSFLCWAAVISTYRRFPGQMKKLGLVVEHWPFNLLIGALVGGILGFHFLIATYLVSGVSFQPLLGLTKTLWIFLLNIGMVALAEELFFRGMGFLLLYEESHNSIWKATSKIILLNLLFYIVPIFNIPNPFWWTWIIIYRLFFSVIAIYLRYRQGSLVSCLACNVIFHTLILTVLKW